MPGYTLSPQARADLIGIWSYSARRWSIEQADRYARLIDEAFAKVARRPGLGRSCDDVRGGYFRIGVGSHVVFYTKTKEGVYVARVLHQGMDFGQHL